MTHQVFEKIVENNNGKILFHVIPSPLTPCVFLVFFERVILIRFPSRPPSHVFLFVVFLLLLAFIPFSSLYFSSVCCLTSSKQISKLSFLSIAFALFTSTSSLCTYNFMLFVLII